MSEKFLEEQITKAFPECTARYYSNLDDIDSCFDIGVDLGTVLRLRFNLNHPAYCGVELYDMAFGGYIEGYAKASYRQIWHGDLPGNEDSHVDFDFLFTMLKNWRNFK
jgi:hypothetical protein